MNTVAIQYIWQAIQESERSDDLAFIDALTRRMPPARSEVLSRESMAAAVVDLLQTSSDTLPIVTLPLVRGPNDYQADPEQ